MTPKVMRSIRVPLALWEAAKSRAERSNEDLSEAIRKFLEEYAVSGSPEEKKPNPDMAAVVKAIEDMRAELSGVRVDLGKFANAFGKKKP